MDSTDNSNQTRELRRGLWTSFAVFTGGGVVGSWFFYLFLFPPRPEIPWSRLVFLGISLWIYYAVFFSALKLRVTPTGLESWSLLLKKFIRWEDIQEVKVKGAYAYSGAGVPGMPLYSYSVLVIIGTHSKIEFSFGPTWGKLHKEGLPWVLEVIAKRTGKSPADE